MGIFHKVSYHHLELCILYRQRSLFTNPIYIQLGGVIYSRILIEPSNKFTSYDFADIDLNDNILIPDTVFMAEQPKICLPESIDFDLPADFKDMFDMRLHSINNDLLPEVISCYEQLNIKYEPLKLIKPQFEIPLPPLQLAVI